MTFTHTSRVGRRGLLITAVAMALMAVGLWLAMSQRDEKASALSSQQSAAASVNVNTQITMTGFAAVSFGARDPDSTPSVTPGAVNVKTNNTTGYNVKARSASANFTGTGGSPPTFPVSALSASDSSSRGTGGSVSSMTTSDQQFFNIASATDNAGDNHSLTWTLDLNSQYPAPDSYSTNLTLTATTNA